MAGSLAAPEAATGSDKQCSHSTSWSLGSERPAGRRVIAASWSHGVGPALGSRCSSCWQRSTHKSPSQTGFSKKKYFDNYVNVNWFPSFLIPGIKKHLRTLKSYSEKGPTSLARGHRKTQGPPASGCRARCCWPGGRGGDVTRGGSGCRGRKGCRARRGR